jgi:hypothetical protein
MPEENTPAEGAPFVTLWADANGQLKFSSKNVGTYTLIGWVTVMLDHLKKTVIGDNK